MLSFNLIHEPWIPCPRRTDHAPLLVGLREVFAQAPRLAQLAGLAPTVTFALHRLLLAILHRSRNGPRTTWEWGAIWHAGAWDLQAINRYLATWHARFDRFDDSPFYQTERLDPQACTDVTELDPRPWVRPQETAALRSYRGGHRALCRLEPPRRLMATAWSGVPR